MTQFIEYKIEQIVKSAEGLYGLIQILPGANQFLKWEALKHNLNLYLKGTESTNFNPQKDTLGLFLRNVFLTEDKLMTTLLMCKENYFFNVDYHPTMLSTTDVPNSVALLLRQR